MIRIVNGVPVIDSSGNVYTDLGFPDAEEMLRKAELTSQLEDRLADLLRGQFRDINRNEIVGCLDRLNLPPPLRI